MNKPQKITIDKLARMMNRSFNSMQTEMRKGFVELKGGIKGTNERLDKVEGRLGGVESRLEKIEFKVNLNNENRLSRLEDDMRILKTKLQG